MSSKKEHVGGHDRYQNFLRALHDMALRPTTPPEESLELLKDVLEDYDNDFDKARVARDVAIYGARIGHLNWSSYLDRSLSLLETARQQTSEGTDEEIAVLRERGSTKGIYGRLAFSTALQTGNDVVYGNTLDLFEEAKEDLQKSSGKGILPDQYEINITAAHTINERYANGRRKALRRLGRAALIAPLTESRFARHRNSGLSKENYRHARNRSMKRLGLAARLAVMPDWYIEREAVRQKAAKIIA
jgi:hypothetical protein